MIKPIKRPNITRELRDELACLFEEYQRKPSDSLMQAMHRIIYLPPVPQAMDREEFDRLVDDIGVTHAELALLVGITYRTQRRYLADMPRTAPTQWTLAVRYIHHLATKRIQ